MSGGKGGGSGDVTTTVRYAPYLEKAHGQYLNHEGSDEPTLSFTDVFNATLNAGPYGSYVPIDIDEGFFGMRKDDPSITYERKNYPSLWDMYGKFMGGLDVHALWAEIYEDVIQGPEIANAVTAQSDLLQDEIDTNVLPKFVGGMRDINAVQSTTFVIGKAIIQAAHVKAINKFSSDIRLHGLDISAAQWARHLDWNGSVVRLYAEMDKIYYSTKADIDKANLDYQAKDAMWNMNLFEGAGGMIGAMAGMAAGGKQKQDDPPLWQSILGGVMSIAGIATAFIP
jgi:hypothetical protein